MNDRLKIIVLSSSVAFFALIFALGLFLLPHSPYAQRSRPFIRDFNASAAQRITIQLSPGNIFYGDGQITLIRTTGGTDSASSSSANENSAGQWGYLLAGELIPARSERVDALLESFAALQRYRTVTSNADLYSELGFDGDEGGTGGRVLLYDAADRLFVDIVQGSVDQQRGVYARLNQSATVELISSELVFYLQQQAGYWQQTQIFPADLTVGDVATVAVSADAILLDPEEGAITTDYQLIRADSAVQGNTISTWSVLGQPQLALDQVSVENAVSSVLRLQADSFSATPASTVDFSTAQARISFSSQAGGARYTVEIISDNTRGAGNYLFRATGPDVATRPDGSVYLYHANSFSIRPLIQPFENLLPPPTEGGVQAAQ